MVKELDQDNLNDIVQKSPVVLVQYAASWCGNCKIIKPKFKKLAEENDNIPFVIVDAEKFPESRKLANVTNLPTFASFKDGKLLSQIQTNKLEPLQELINEVTGN